MSGHTDLVNELEKALEAYNGSYTPERVHISFKDVTWDQRVYLNNPKTKTKNITEDIDSGSQENEIVEYFKASVDMNQSWKINENYRTEVSIDIKPNQRLPKYVNGQLSFEEGVPKTIAFPHIGTTEIVESTSTPLPSDLPGPITCVRFEEKTIKGSLKVRTFFHGDVIVKQDYEEQTFDINELLEAVKVLKTTKNRDQYFESRGTIKIHIRHQLPV